MAENRRSLGGARLCALLALALAAGCARGPLSADRTRSASAPLRPADPAGVQLALIETMVQEQHCYAALAHLDALPPGLARKPHAVWLRGEALRRTQRPQAAAEQYRSLLATDWAGSAHRGLGLIAAQEGDLDSAIAELERARALRPTDGRIRNDLGYALLLDGRVSDARIELATAIDLDEPAGVRNMLLLLRATGDEDGERALLERHPLAEGSRTAIRAAAERLTLRWQSDAPQAMDPAEGAQQESLGPDGAPWIEEMP